MSDEKKLSLDSHEKKVSYGFGWQFGRQLQKNNFEGFDLEAAVTAIRQCFAGEASALSDDELNEAYDAVKEKRQEAERKRQEQYKELCETFLQENLKREGVTATESGIQYEILEAGEGSKPSATDTVKVHYHGSFIDGQVFDSSVTRNEPAEFALNQVIPGWTEILQLMPINAKWRVVIPYQLAYGEAGSPPVIPPHAALVFEIHLLDIL